MKPLLGLASILLAAAALTGCRPSEAATTDGLAAADPSNDGQRLRRVWSDAGDEATPSPDGRLIAFVDWSTGGVAVHDIATGENRPIMAKGSPVEDGSWAESPVFSPDGRKVAYSYRNVMSRPRQYELRYVELGDTTQHLLTVTDAEEDWIVPLDWSERGILFIKDVDSEHRSFLGILDPANSKVTVLDPEYEGGAGRFSPDSRFIAYEMDGLKVRDLAGGTVASIDVPTMGLLDWTQDGRGLLVHSALEGRAGLWLIPVADGRQAGQPRLVQGGIPAILDGGRRAGDAFYYRIRVDGPKVHVASVDMEAGRLLSTPMAVSTFMDGAAWRVTWSPDGRQLAYLLRGSDGDRLMVRQTEGNGLRQLATLTTRQIQSMVWTPDGREILLLEFATGDAYAVAVSDGRIRKVRSGVGPYGDLLPDGRTMVVAIRDRPRSGIEAVDLVSGERRVLETLASGGPRGVSVSPDGRSIAYVHLDPGQWRSGPIEEAEVDLRLLPVGGGPARTVVSVRYPKGLSAEGQPLPWTSDGKHVVVAVGDWEGEGGGGLWVVPVDGGAMYPIEMPGLRVTGPPALSPSDDRLALVAGHARAELWVLDGIDDQVDRGGG